jgi:erythronate-4-phosphate dehydrogenase
VEAVFCDLGQVELAEGRSINRSMLQQAEVLLVRSVTRVDGDLLRDTPVRFVGTATAGVDHIDQQELAQLGVGFAHAPGSNADSVVDYVLSAICQCEDYLEQLLAGARVGIVGYGHVGRRLRNRLAALGIQSAVYDPWLSRDDFAELGELQEVLCCEVVCLHAELTHRQPWPSYHMLAAAELSQLPENALLINAGRGELVDPQALLQCALARPSLRLILDVWEGEPTVDLALLQRCQFGSPHIAGYSFDGKLRATLQLATALCDSLGVTAPEVAQPEPPVCVVPATLGGASLLRWLVAQAYDIRVDDSLLRAAVPDGFDELRRSYRRRREISSLLVSNGKELTVSARASCAALGCGIS